MSRKQYLYDYPENREIGAKLNIGDAVFIAKTVGCHVQYVRQVLKRGVRNNEKIKKIALKLIALREEISNC
ncbi:MAG: hypothetical protein WCL00_02225 [Bacteroidota bacterium]